MALSITPSAYILLRQALSTPVAFRPTLPSPNLFQRATEHGPSSKLVLERSLLPEWTNDVCRSDPVLAHIWRIVGVLRHLEFQPWTFTHTDAPPTGHSAQLKNVKTGPVMYGCGAIGLPCGLGSFP